MIVETSARGERYMTPPTLDRESRCPRCDRETARHGFLTPDGLWLVTHHCPAHGPICPKGQSLENRP